MMGYGSRFAAMLEEYAEFRAALGFSEQHARCLLRFDAYCSEFRPDASSLSADVVRGWFEREARVGAGQLAHKAAAVRGLAKHAGRSAYVLPSGLVPKAKPFEPYIMDDRELYRFFEAVDAFVGGGRTDPFLPLAMRVMLRAVYACGLRPGEARRLAIGDVNVGTGEMAIRGSKNGRDRIVVAADDVAGMLDGYLGRRAAVPGGSARDPLFARSDGSAITDAQLTRYVKLCWRDANPGVAACDLPRLRPYDLRHRFATEALQRWIDEGRDIYAMLPRLRAYMGHVNFGDTAYYIHLLPGRLAKSPGVDWGAVNGVRLEEGLWRA